MKAIFLDFDGVLISRRSLIALHKLPRGMEGRPSHKHAADQEAVKALNTILDAVPDAELVVSSTWRLDRSVKQLSDLLIGWGVRRGATGTTPRRLCPGPGQIVVADSRGTEIAQFLKMVDDPPEQFIILDDDDDMEALSTRLIKTEFETGLTMADAERAIAMLGVTIAKESII